MNVKEMEIAMLPGHGDVVSMIARGPIVQRTLMLSNPMGEMPGVSGYDRKVILSLAEVTLFDSTALGWLLKCNKRFREGGGSLVIHSIPPVVLDMMKIMGLPQVLRLAEDEQAALAMIEGVAQ